MDKKYLLFDLDGTVTDSNLGITRCVQYALLDQGIDEQDMSVLEEYIGPALDDSFKKYHGLNDEQAAKAVAKYRERYRDTGIFENEVYDGIVPCLETLKAAGKIICLSTCKPEPFAVRILEHFKLDKYFDVVTGSDLEGTRKQKYQVIEETFKRLSANVLRQELTEELLNEIKADSVMIGDRNQDVNGAHKVGIECIGVRYGYAKPDELEDAGADYIVEIIPELTALILAQ
mgnify:FL=1